MEPFWELVASVTGAMPPPPRPDAQRQHVAIVGADGRIVADLPCHHCGYDLRSLSAGATCPECGTPVRASVRGNILVFSDPQWLRRVATGAQCMGWFGLIGMILGGVWLFTMMVVFAMFILAAVVAFLAGAWMATTPDPSGIDEARCARLRLIARALLCTGLLAAPVSALRGHVHISENLIRSTTALLIAAGFGGVLAILRYFQRLTLRIPDGRLFAALEGHFRVLLITVTAAAVSIVFMNAFERLAVRFPAPLLCLMVLPMFVVIFLSFRFLSICRELACYLNAQAKIAETLWPRS
jgi:hypothetical protein